MATRTPQEWERTLDENGAQSLRQKRSHSLWLNCLTYADSVRRLARAAPSAEAHATLLITDNLLLGFPVVM
jgi:hypothetical protein